MYNIVEPDRTRSAVIICNSIQPYLKYEQYQLKPELGEKRF